MQKKQIYLTIALIILSFPKKNLAQENDSTATTSTEEKKINKKQLYSYTWNSEKKKIFEKKQKEVYSTETTRYVTLEDFKNNINVPFINIYDINYLLIHRYTFNEQQDFRLQNLGIDCTPARYIFYDKNTEIGSTSGINIFDPYYTSINELEIYDTKSPYTYIFIIPGRNISKFTLEYSQNVSPNWNIGFTFHNSSMGIPYQKYPSIKSSLIRLLTFHSYFNLKDSYHCIVSLKHMKSYWKELIPFSKTGDYKDVLSFNNEDKIPFYPVQFQNINLEYPKNQKPLFINSDRDWINFTKNVNFRWQFNIYQQYLFLEKFYIFHDFNYYYKNDSLGARDADELESGHPKVCGIRSISLHNYINELGTKSLFNEFLFFKPYYKNKIINRIYDHLKIELKKESTLYEFEHYLGLRSLIFLTKENILGIRGEYLLPKYYSLNIFFKNNFLNVELNHYKKKDPFLFRDFWNYDISNPVQSHIQKRKFEYTFPLITNLKINLTIFNNSYFQVKPTFMSLLLGKEYSNLDIFGCPGLIGNFSYNSLHWDNEAIVSFSLSENSRYNLPLLFLNSSIYYQNSFFNDDLKIATGFDIHFKTKYTASIYDAGSKDSQYIFKPEDSYPEDVWGYPFINYFLNIFYNNLCIFFKITHVNQGILSANFFVTNKYPAQRRSFDLGICYKFFN